MNTYQVKVLITIAHTMEVQVEGYDDDDIARAAFDDVDALLGTLQVGLDYTMEITDIQEAVDFPKSQELL